MFIRNSSVIKKVQSNNLDLKSFDFFEALNRGDIEIVKSFFSDPDFKVWQLKDENDYTALHFSVLNNNEKLTDLIIQQLKKGVGMGSTQKIENFINEKNNEGMTVLHYAVINGNIKTVQLLKSLGADLDAVTNEGKNVMHLAASNNQVSMLMYLYLNEGLDVLSVDESGSTPLHWACYYSSEESANYLLSLKVDINAQDKDKVTPLHLATSKNAINIVKTLLRNGADRKKLNIENQLPIDIARKNNFKEIYEILANTNFNPLCTLELPNENIKPNDSLKKIIFLMIIVSELIIIILVLPFIESVIYYLINLIAFALCLLSYILLLGKEPGYLKNKELLKECQEEGKDEGENYQLKKLIEKGCDLKAYCPVCNIIKGENKKHCFICNKCVLEMSHHCFWLNKCIGKNNKNLYIIFIFFSLLNAFLSIFICALLIFDRVHLEYESKYMPSWLILNIDRGFRVLGAGVVGIFSVIVSFPLSFLFMIEMFKLCGLLGKKKNIEKELNKDVKILINEDNNSNLEMQHKKEPLIINDDSNENNDEIDDKIKIPNNNFPLYDDRSSKL